MRITCPYCKAVLNPKGVKPGLFQPTCPGCDKPFVLLVPDDPRAAVTVQPIAAKPAPAPDTAKTAVVKPEANPAPAPAEAVSKAEEPAFAEEIVDRAPEVKRSEGEKEPAGSARDRRPKPGMTIAGKPHRDLWFKHFMNDWFGRRLRFALGALIFAPGLLWMYQNNLLEGNGAFAALVEGNVTGAWQAACETGKAVTKPLAIPGDVVAVPNELNSWALPITGLLVMANGLVYFGWRPTLVTVPGAAVAVCGPLLGIPAVDPLTAQHLSLIIGAVLIVVVARFLRH